ncbi:MAG TPA: hypothetical protein PK264_14615 [Hyphomicrobiaceae bacterium]|nr:hypothetical protein [Hyphomicrobiaceae bacterium]
MIGNGDIDRFVIGVCEIGIILEVLVAVARGAAVDAAGMLLLVAVGLGAAAVDIHALEEDDVLGMRLEGRDRRASKHGDGGWVGAARIEGAALEEMDVARGLGERRRRGISHAAQHRLEEQGRKSQCLDEISPRHGF